MTIPTRYNGQNIDASWFNLLATEISNDASGSDQITFADSPYSVSIDNIIYCDSASGNISVVLPQAVDNVGRRIIVVKISSDSNTVTVNRTSPDLINLSTSYVIKRQFDSATFHSNGVSVWRVLAGPTIRYFSTGRVAFGDTDGSLSQDNNIFWDNVNKRLGINYTLPISDLHVVGTSTFGSSGGSVVAGPLGLNIYDNLPIQLNNSANSFRIDIKAPSALAANWTFTLPINNGTNNYLLKSDGAGVTSWVTALSTITDRTTGYIPFGLSGSFGQDSALFWDNTNKRLGVNITPLTEVHVAGTIRGTTGEFGSSQEVVASTSGVELKNNKVLSLYELTANGSNKVNLKAPANLTTGDYDFTFPDDGNEPTGKFLRTNSGGNTYFGGINDIRSIEGFAISVSVNGFNDLVVDARSRDENTFGGSTTLKPAMIGFRNSNIHTSSTIPNFEVYDDKQVVIDKSSTLGFYDLQVSHVYVYAINVNNTSGGLVIGVSKYPFRDDIPRQYLSTPTTPGNITQAIAASANNAFYIYVQNALTNTSNYAIKMIGEFEIQHTTASTGSWINNVAYEVVNGTYESLYKEPLVMKRFVGNEGADLTLVNAVSTHFPLRSLISHVENFDNYSMYVPQSSSATYSATTGKWENPPGTAVTPVNCPHLIIPIEGYYRLSFSARVQMKNNAVGNQITLYIDKNLVTQSTGTSAQARDAIHSIDAIYAAKTERFVGSSTLHYFNAGDLVYPYIRQEGGASDAHIDFGGSASEHWHLSLELIQENQ